MKGWVCRLQLLLSLASAVILRSESRGFMIIVYCLKFEAPQPGVPGHRIYIPQEQGGPVIPPDTGLPFYGLIRLAGLRWRYSTPPPHELSDYKIKVKLRYNRRSVDQSVLVPSTHLGLKTRFLLLSDSFGFVDVGRPLWREDGSAVYNCRWLSSQHRYFQFRVPRDLWPYFTLSDSTLPQPGRPSPCIYIP
jgi:hypothetical protein